MTGRCRRCRGSLPTDLMVEAVLDRLLTGEEYAEQAEATGDRFYSHLGGIWFRDAAERALALLLGLHGPCAEGLVGQLAGIRLAVAGGSPDA